MQKAQLTSVEVTKTFILAGNATFTIVSVKTGVRFTFKVSKPDPKPGQSTPPHFVSLLNGPDNTGDYQFLGSIFDGQKFCHGKKSKVSPEAPSAKGFAWLWTLLIQGTLPSNVEIWHEGRCGRCGRKLTVPESLTIGLGPDCASRDE